MQAASYAIRSRGQQAGRHDIVMSTDDFWLISIARTLFCLLEFEIESL